jgi:hypothetical protein
MYSKREADPKMSPEVTVNVPAKINENVWSMGIYNNHIIIGRAAQRAYTYYVYVSDLYSLALYTT